VFEAAFILGGSVLTVATALALGGLIHRALGLDQLLEGALERGVFAYGTGAAVLSAVVFVLCALHAAYPLSFAAVSLCALAACLPGASWRALRSGAGGLSVTKIDPWTWVLLSIAVPYGCVYFIYALAPEVSADGVAYHLGLVRRYSNEHGFPHITTNIYAFLSQGAEMLYLFAYSFGKHSAAKIVHFSFLAGTVPAVLCFARRYATRRAGTVAAVLYLAAPVVGMDATTSYNDCVLAFYLLLVFYSLVLWWDTFSGKLLVLAGGLGGFCFAIKYTGGIALAAVVLTIVARSAARHRQRRLVIRDFATVSAAATLFILPWMTKNAIIVGNPVAPFFNEWFPNPYVTVAWERDYTRQLRHFNGFAEDGSWREYATAPLEVTAWGSKVQSIIGPIFLLLPLAAFGWRKPRARAVFIGACVAALPWTANAGVRFLIPALPLASLALAIGLDSLPGRWASRGSLVVVAVHAALSWPWIIPKWHPDWIWRVEPPLPWRYALRLRPEAEYLEQWVPSYKVAQRIEALAEPGSRVLSLEQLPEAYMDTEVLVCYQAAPNERLFRALFTPLNRDYWPTKSLLVPLQGQPLTRVRIVQTNTHPTSPWSVSEVRIVSDEHKTVQRAGRVTAVPFPWDGPRVFDGDLYSRWESGEPLHAGMRIEIELPTPVKATGVEMVYPHSQYFAQVQFEFQYGDDGGWVPNEREPVAREREVSEADLKRWAGEELRRNGIDFLATDVQGIGHNFIAPKIAEDPGNWGLAEIYRDGGRRLYRVIGSAPQTSAVRRAASPTALLPR
jgi:hypothetical protein